MENAVESIVIQIADDGHLLIPAETVATLGFLPGERVILKKQDGDVLLQPSRRERLERLGALTRLALTGVDPADIKAIRTDRCF